MFAVSTKKPISVYCAWSIGEKECFCFCFLEKIAYYGRGIPHLSLSISPHYLLLTKTLFLYSPPYSTIMLSYYLVVQGATENRHHFKMGILFLYDLLTIDACVF